MEETSEPVDKVYVGNLLGSHNGKACHIINIDEKDKINYVEAISDADKLRKLRIHLASGKMRSYG